MRQRDLVQGAAVIVRIARVANGLMLAAIVVGLAGTWAFPGSAPIRRLRWLPPWPAFGS